MKRFFQKALSGALALSLACGLTAPALASEALGEALAQKDTLLHEETQLSTNVFWSTAYSDLRTEHLITYAPNSDVQPIVTAGDVLTARDSVAEAAARLEAEGYRVVAGINGDFYNVGNGLPVGIVVTEGELRSSDAGYCAIGFRSDGTALLGKPGVTVSADLGYGVDRGSGYTEIVRKVAAVNKARTNSGIYLYTYDFNDRHSTGNTESGIDVLCTIQEGGLAIGGQLRLTVERVAETTSATVMQPGQVVLSVNLKADSYYVDALRDVPVGAELVLDITAADPAWNEVEYAIGALYSLVENGAVVSGLPSGINPRTAVGQKADGTLVFYTIDGRKSGHSVGASLTQVAQRLIELGCETAVCLDGGGSTNLAVTAPDSTAAAIVNTPSESGRRVTNQIFLVADSRASGRLDHFYVKADSDYVLAGSSVTVSATGVDTSYIPMEASYDLTASGGKLVDGVLITPVGGGDITVTASGRRASGSTVVHAIAQPDSLTLKNGSTALTELAVLPGSRTTLTAGAVWNHLTLKADPAAFTWTVEGNVGSVDENGVFTASNPGSGTLTVSTGNKSLSIPVTVTRAALRTLADFEDGCTVSGGFGAAPAWNTNMNYVRLGRGSLDLAYTDLDYGPVTAWTDYPVSDLYSQVNLWVYGDGSGNLLSLVTSDGATETESSPLTLDFTGWQQVSFPLPEDAEKLTGLRITGAAVYSYDEFGAETVIYPVSAGRLYLDQIVASFSGTVDNEPPVVTAALDSENWTVTAQVSDGVDGVLPAASVTVTYNGKAADCTYDAKTGAVTVALPALGESGEAARVTVTARDASGNIGRASVDVDSYNVGHRFTDIDDYWGASYVDFLYNAGITTGFADGSFRPDQKITRAQFAVMLYRYLGLEAEAWRYEDVELPFADLKSIGDFAVPAVKALYSQGILNGTEKNGQLYFYPNSSLTRAQAAAMIGRTQAKGYALADLSFTDSGRIPAYAAEYIRAMVSQGVISGYSDGSFKPNSSITRGQMAKILYNLM